MCLILSVSWMIPNKLFDCQAIPRFFFNACHLKFLQRTIIMICLFTTTWSFKTFCIKFFRTYNMSYQYVYMIIVLGPSLPLTIIHNPVILLSLTHDPRVFLFIDLFVHFVCSIILVSMIRLISWLHNIMLIDWYLDCLTLYLVCIWLLNLSWIMTSYGQFTTWQIRDW